MTDYNYFLDPRVIELSLTTPQFDEGRMVFIMTVEDDDGEQTFEIPAVFEICGLCQGRGKHVNPSVDCNGLTREDFDADPDFARGYWSGAYDVTCHRCHGKRVEPVPNTDAIGEEDAELLNQWKVEIEADHEYAALCAMERALGC
jgi:hypothetical protein